ncbi:ABC transporter ATP-binding protein/permease [Vibrio kyushuensis]|uniref:ATP-binding cassette domain-containing protein n=1 Tax=Vibrio kyushuensis TaxID=2910249 RepID=UPI003D0E5BC5
MLKVTYLKYSLLFFILLLLKANLALPSYLIGQIINVASQSISLEGMETLLTYLLLSTVVTISISPFFTYFFEQEVQLNVETKSRILFSQLIRKPFSHFKRLEIGSLASKFERGIGSYEQFINLSVSRGLPLVIELLVFCGAIVLFSGWGTFALVIVILATAALIKTLIIRLRRPHIRRVNEAEDEILDQLVGVFSGIRTIQSNRVEGFFEKRIAPFFEHYRQTTVSLAVSRSVFDGVAIATHSLMSLSIIALFIFYLFPVQHADAGALVTALLLSASLSRAFAGLLDVYRLLDQSQEDFSALKEILSHKGEGSEVSELLSKALEELAKPNVKTIAVIGKSGQGKTILLDTLAGLLTPKPVSPLSSNYLEQNNFVFSGSVYDNLSLGKEMDIDWLTSQLDKIGLSSRLSLDSELHGNGQNLSGGEKRRLCFLRAYIQSPELLLLDEPTTGLDSQTGHDLWKVIFSLLEPQTKMVVVTHDNSYLDHFDKVITLDEVGVVLYQPP